MKLSYILIFTFILNTLSFAQKKEEHKDAHKNGPKPLEVKRFYNVGVSKDSVAGKVTYKVNGKEVDKKTYNMYQVTMNNMKTCKPCLLETYDINGTLLFKAAQYLDCMVGEWTEYYPSGKVKVAGHYRENEHDTWDMLWDGGYCVKHGTWTYYDETGKVTNSEKYSFGNLETSHEN
jgi:antitoxin component YwqK of YwqJK toxin-antitoxin module